MQPGMVADAPERRDFFISFCEKYREHAERINEIVRAQGKTTFFFTNRLASGDVASELRDAVEYSNNIICVVSPGYFDSPFCGDELNAFWLSSSDKRNILFLVVDECKIPKLYLTVRRNRLTGISLEGYEFPVTTAINNMGKIFTEQETVEQDPDAGSVKQREPPVEREETGMRTNLAGVFGAAALMLAYGSYFQFGPMGEWDVREIATYQIFRRDISLPWTWIWRPADLLECVTEITPDATSQWVAFAEVASTLKASGRWITVQGGAVLGSTESGDRETPAEFDGIAQYRTVFTGGSVALLADVQGKGKLYRGFEIEHQPGRLVPSFVEQGRTGKNTLKSYQPVPVSISTAIHDLGISKDGNVFSLYVDRKVLANWQPNKKEALAWRGGGFGIFSDGTVPVHVLRWSVAAVRRPAGATAHGDFRAIRIEIAGTRSDALRTIPVAGIAGRL